MDKNIKTFKQVLNFLNGLPDINLGGCGISLLSMIRWLKKNKGINKFTMLFLYNCEENFINNGKALKNKKGDIIAPTHCGLIRNGKLTDSTGKISSLEYNWTQKVTDETFLMDMINNIETWNLSFDRELIYKIGERLGIELNGIVREY